MLHPWSNDKVPDPSFPPTGPVYEEAPKPLPGLAGESRDGDANGQWVRVLTSGGDRTVNIGNDQFAQAYRPILGTNPPKPVRAAADAGGRGVRDAGAARSAHRGGPRRPGGRAGPAEDRRGAGALRARRGSRRQVVRKGQLKLEGLTSCACTSEEVTR